MGCHQSSEKKLLRLDTETLLSLPNGFRSSATIIRQDDIVDRLSDHPASPLSSREMNPEAGRPVTPVPVGMLFEDFTFSADDSSIGLTGFSDVEWLRPHQLCDSPKLFVDGVSRADVKQGVLGDCWLLSACAAVATREELLQRVVDPSQSLYDCEYFGQITFRFWNFGEIVEVSIDDRLPTISGKLIFASCTHPQEFWLPLLEKGFAKMYGSYGALEGGHAASALADLTGGIAERLFIQNCSFQELETILKHEAFATCAGYCDDSDMSGLVQGHAYTVTGAAQVTMTSGESAQLMRLRSPWADSIEWRGRWSDRSKDWNEVCETEKDRLRVITVDDGEFWMGFSDFQVNFQEMTVATVGPDFDRDGSSDCPRQATSVRGAWTEMTSGGSRNNLDLFQRNPQYILTIPETQHSDPTSVLVGLMQQPAPPNSMHPIAFFIYKTDNPEERLLAEYFLCTPETLKSGAFLDSLEVIARASLPPGHYVIIPATFLPNSLAQFLLRVYSLQPFTLTPLLSDQSFEY